MCLGALLSTLPDEFSEHYVGHDFNVRSCKLLRRPDMFFDVGRFGVLIKIDKHGHLTVALPLSKGIVYRPEPGKHV